MPYPSFLGPGTRIDLRSKAFAPAAPSSTLGGAGTSSQNLSFTIQSQLQTNWCWAAVSTSVSLHYAPTGSWTQCKVADNALPRNDCCSGAASDPQKCNVPWYLERALGVTGNLENMLSQSLTFAQVQQEIADGTPIGCRVGWFGGGGHFLVIQGWLVGATGTEYVEVADPIYLNSQIPYDDFAVSYQSGGDWTHSYLTEAPAAGGAVAALAVAGIQISDLAAIGA
jgi:hypothetical protein